MTPQTAQKRLEEWCGIYRVVVGRASWWEGARSWCIRNRVNPSRYYAFASYNDNGIVREPQEAFRTLADLSREAVRILPKDFRVYE